MNALVTIPATYDYRLVSLSVVIAVLRLIRPWTSRDASPQIETTPIGVADRGATAMGTGIWSMHYTGMLALPSHRMLAGRLSQGEVERSSYPGFCFRPDLASACG